MRRPLRPLPSAGLAALPLLVAACGPPAGIRIAATTLPLPSGRFATTLELPVPPRAAHHNDEYMLRLSMVAACDPELTVRWPDGEEDTLAPEGWGVDEGRWQSLLAERAAAPKPRPRPAASPPPAAAPVPAAAPAPAAPPPPGHYQQVAEGSWPGQIEFLNQRARRCARVRTYHLHHRLAYEEGHVVTIFAKVPQELSAADLTLEVDDLPGTAPPPPHPSPAPSVGPPPAPAIDVAATTPAPPSPPVSPPAPAPRYVLTPTSPMPPPRRTHPAAKDPQAQAKWHPGHWVWNIEGHWEWSEGWWDPPDITPPPRAEHPGTPVVAAARWHAGHWLWVEDGHWEWSPGYWDPPSEPPPSQPHGAPPLAGCTWSEGARGWDTTHGAWVWSGGAWNPPPPLPETPGDSPGSGSTWLAGSWEAADASFVWVPGRWTEPDPRAETPPPPPYPNAHWIAGTWIAHERTWQWIPGFYATPDGRTPPPPKNETPGAPPVAGAVWLAGYWCFDDSGSRYQWVAGHWESPPGVGYVWVTDPSPTGYVIVPRGHWVLSVQVQAGAVRGRRP